MLPQDYSGKQGPKMSQPDVVKVREPKEEKEVQPTPTGTKPFTQEDQQ